MKKLFFNHPIISTIAIIVIAVLLFAAVHAYVRWSDEYYFGDIISISDDRITIQTSHSSKETLLIDDDTVIKRGRNRLNNGLSIGTPLMVIGSPDEEGRIHARLIRIIDKKLFRK